jgi:CubicO group peptidase (beta-lactamase class C family)
LPADNFEYEVATTDIFAQSDDNISLVQSTGTNDADSSGLVQNNSGNLEKQTHIALATKTTLTRPPIDVEFIEWQIPSELLCAYAEQIDPSFASLTYLQSDASGEQPENLTPFDKYEFVDGLLDAIFMLLIVGAVLSNVTFVAWPLVTVADGLDVVEGGLAEFHRRYLCIAANCLAGNPSCCRTKERWGRIGDECGGIGREQEYAKLPGVTTDNGDANGPHSFGWRGIGGTLYVVDPANDFFLVYMEQRRGGPRGAPFSNSTAQRMIYEAMRD